jgi:hypothetical protein
MARAEQDILTKAYALRNRVRDIQLSIQLLETEREQLEHEIDRYMGEWRQMASRGWPETRLE